MAWYSSFLPSFVDRLGKANLMLEMIDNTCHLESEEHHDLTISIENEVSHLELTRRQVSQSTLDTTRNQYTGTVVARQIIPHGKYVILNEITRVHFKPQ